MAGYVGWLNARYGKISVRLFCKLHIMHTLHGMICVAAVTPGNANDSPYLRQMIEMLPEGDGDVPADAAYGGIENCNAVRDGGRRAIIDSKSNAVIKGFNAKAEMSRFPRGVPGDLPPDTAPSEQRRERLLVDEGAVRRGRTRHQGEDPVGGAAIDDRLLQHGLRLRPHRGGGNPRGYGKGCPRLPTDRHQRRLRRAARTSDPASTPHLPADPGASVGIKGPPIDFLDKAPLAPRLKLLRLCVTYVNIPKLIRRYCPKCDTHTEQKISIYKAGKRRGSARGERRHAERKKGYGGQKFPKLAKPAKVTKKVTPLLTCSTCKKKFNTHGIRIKKFELVAA